MQNTRHENHFHNVLCLNEAKGMDIKMKNKYKASLYIFLIFIMFILSGCSNSAFDYRKPSDKTSTLNEIIPIYDTEDNLIDNMEHYGSITQTDTGFVYSKQTADSTSDNYVMKYYYYNFSTRDHDELGVIQGWAYEAVYDTFYSDNHVYMLVTTGSVNNYDETENYLYDINILDETMTGFLLDGATSPYNSMTLIDDKIYIVMPGSELCLVSCFDIENKTISKIKEYYYNSDTDCGESIRHISSDEEYVYMLRLYMENISDAKIYIDIFDQNLTPVSSLDVTDDIIKDTPEGEDKNSELRQLVSHFEIDNNIVYYENFSITRAMFRISNVRLASTERYYTKHILECNSDLYKASSITDSDDMNIFYKAYDNDVFVMNTNDNLIQKSEFKIDDPNYYITYMTCNSQGDILLFMSYIGSGNSNEMQKNKIYYLNVEDIL